MDQQLTDLHDAYITAVRRLQQEPDTECCIVDVQAGDVMIGSVVLVRGPAARDLSTAVRNLMDQWEQPTQPFFPQESE